jgi:hypothetical protein
MSENALPTLLNSSSEALASSVDGNRPDSRSSDEDSVTPLMPSESLPAKEIDSGKGDGKSDSKQKRKRTR